MRSSSFVPRVATQRAWVWPRVKRAEPCVRGRIELSQVTSRTSSSALPSMRRFSLRIITRISALSSASISALICFAPSGKRSASPSRTSALISSIKPWRSSLAGILLASFIRSLTSSPTAATSSVSTSSASIIIFSLPTSATSFSCIVTRSLICS